MDERLAGYWEHFLGDGLGRGKHPRAKAGGRNDRLRNSLTIVHSKTTFEEMREENFGRKGFCREIGSWDFILCRGLRGFPLHLSDFGFRLGNWEVPNRRLKGFGVRSYRGGIDHENEYAGICTLGAGLRCGRHLIGYWDDSGVARTTVAQALD